MGFSFANLVRWPLLAGVALAVACPVPAQNAGRRPGQSILFSSPDGDDISSNMPSLAAKPPEMLDLMNAAQSPALKLSATPDATPLPAPVPSVSPAQAQQMQRRLDEQKNWMLMTPEEILGVSTPEKILGVQARDASGLPKNESVVAQYYERQAQSRVRTNNEYYGVSDSTARWDVSGGREPQLNPGIWAPAGNRPENSVLMNQFLNGAPDSRVIPAPGNGWSKSFTAPVPPPKATPEQQAAVEQFRQLLQPHSQSSSAAKAPLPGSSIFSSSFTTPNPAPEPSSVIPIGQSFTPLSSGIGMPAGLTRLPGILGPTNTAPALLVPEWRPQPPPWVSSAPQLGAIPQRKF